MNTAAWSMASVFVRFSQISCFFSSTFLCWTVCILRQCEHCVQTHGSRVPWEDPSDWVIKTYPWTSQGSEKSESSPLLRLRPEDVGYDMQAAAAASNKAVSATVQSDTENTTSDPLVWLVASTSFSHVQSLLICARLRIMNNCKIVADVFTVTSSRFVVCSFKNRDSKYAVFVK